MRVGLRFDAHATHTRADVASWDAGDCGIDKIYNSLVGFNATLNTTRLEIAEMSAAVYFNLTFAHNATITDGSHDNGDVIRTATISQKNKVLTLTLHRNSSGESLLSISYEKVVCE